MIFGIPTSIFAGLGSFLMSFLGKTFTNAQADKAAQAERSMKLAEHAIEANRSDTRNEIRLIEANTDAQERLAKADPQMSVTRRVLVYISLFIFGSILYLGTIFNLSFFEVITQTITNNGFFGIGASSKEVTEIITATGIPMSIIGTLDVLVTSIAGYYFGNSIAKR